MEEVKNVTREETPGQPRVTERAGLFSPETIANLSTTASWMKIMAIVNYVMAGLLFAGAVVLASHGNALDIPKPYRWALIVLAIAFLVALLGWHLQSISKGYRKFSLDQRDITALEDTFSDQRHYWRQLGVMFLVYISVSLIAFVIADAILTYMR
jgi:hypothetical protein